MVGRKNSLLVTKRSLRNAETGSGKRPRRVVQPKLLDDTVGMSRQEEQELNKALYASLNDSRRSKSMPSLTSFEIQATANYYSGHSSNSNSTNGNSSTGSGGVNGSSSSSMRSVSMSSKRSPANSGVLSLGKRRAARTGYPPPKRFFRRSDSAVHRSRSSANFTKTSGTHKRVSKENLAVDESSQDSVRSSSSSVNGSKKKIHAQRKFAQGCSLPGTPTSVPTKTNTPPIKLLSHAPKTEDFLTFLCLRGSSVLPPHLDFFNFSREELPARSEGSRSDLCGSRGKRIREAIPDENSSTSSGANEEIVEAAVATPTMTNKNLISQSRRSAARASAGTPETARGIVSLRQGLQRKVSSSSSSSSSSPHLCVSSPSRAVPETSHTNTPPCLYKPKFYFIPEKASPSEGSGVLPGEFTPPSKAQHMSKHSPLIYRPSPSELGLRASSSRTSVRSPSSSSSPSSVRSSPSGASKRKQASTFFSSRTDCQASPSGAFTPVSSPSHSRLRRSGSKQSQSSSVKRFSQAQIRRAEALKSARKNLFGKLTSVTKQTRKTLGHHSTSEKRSSPLRKGERSQTTTKETSRSPEKRGSRTSTRAGNRKGRVEKRYEDDEDYEDKSTKKKSARKLKGTGLFPRRKKMTRDKPKRRVSERLKIMLQSAHIRRRRLISEDEDEGDNWDSTDSAGGMKKSNSSESVSKKDSSSPKPKKDRQASSTKATTRKSFKIRAPERVRTRGYSLLQASKQALQRAKRENIARNNFKKAEKDSKTRSNFEQLSTRSRSSLRRSVSKESDKRSATRSEEDGINKADSGADSRSGSLSSTSSHAKDLKSKSATPSPKQLHKKLKSGSRSSSHVASSSSSSSSSPAKDMFMGDETIPTFHPTEAEFSDPLSYISQIAPIAEPYGMCKIMPPTSWKLDSTKINEDIRFMPQVQYIHRLYERWGPSVQQTVAINQHLMSELSDLTSSPQIGGVEIDLPQLHAVVEEAGGLAKMGDKKNWAKVADVMNIPKQAMDRTNRLYDIYCRHVLPYATLSAKEQGDLEEEVRAIHELQTLEDDAITKGKSMTVGWFSRIARNVKAMWFKDDPSPGQTESEYLKLLEGRDRHVAVQCGHINTLAQASAFPTRKDSSYSRHPWNLNNVPNNKASILKYLGPVPGTTIPTLHVGMLFSTSCWSTDPHGLPYIQYLHSGSDILWYCIPKSQRSKFRLAMMEMVSSLIANKPRWLKEDCVMVNPNLLKEKGLKVGRCVHKPRQFVVVFPGAHTATVCCGYSISESVHFASNKWLSSGIDASLALTRSGEKELFAMSALLIKLAQDKDVDVATLTEALPLLSSIIYKELDLRTQLHAAGLRSEKKSLLIDSPPSNQSSGSKKRLPVEEEKVCEICERICHLSLVYIDQEEQILCLDHGLKHLQKKKNTKSTRLYVKYNQPELESIVKEAKDRLTHLTSTGSGCNKTRSTGKQSS